MRFPPRPQQELNNLRSAQRAYLTEFVKHKAACRELRRMRRTWTWATGALVVWDTITNRQNAAKALHVAHTNLLLAEKAYKFALAEYRFYRSPMSATPSGKSNTNLHAAMALSERW